MRVKTQLTIRFWDAQDNPAVHQDQKVPSIARVAGAFGFLIFNHAFDGPDLYGPAVGGAASEFNLTTNTVKRYPFARGGPALSADVPAARGLNVKWAPGTA
jgi:hypothetical protein